MCPRGGLLCWNRAFLEWTDKYCWRHEPIYECNGCEWAKEEYSGFWNLEKWACSIMLKNHSKFLAPPKTDTQVPTHLSLVHQMVSAVPLWRPGNSWQCRTQCSDFHAGPLVNWTLFHPQRCRGCCLTYPQVELIDEDSLVFVTFEVREVVVVMAVAVLGEKTRMCLPPECTTMSM